MKKNLLLILLGISPFLFSCQKDELITSETPTAVKAPDFPGIDLEGVSRENCEPFPFGILALNNGNLTTYGLNATANMGYSQNVVSTISTGLSLNGTCYVHSAVGNLGSLLTTVVYSLPLSVLQNNPQVDWKLDQANQHATNLSSLYSGIAPNLTYGNITSNRSITSTCAATGNANMIVNVGSINLNDERLTLIGAPGADDGFIINVTGNMTLTDSEIKLTNVRPERVLFNFMNNSTIQIKTDTKFRGTILAPTGSVTYTNPDIFHGSIVAKTIYAVTYGGGYCGGGDDNSFLQKTYCNGYQWE